MKIFTIYALSIALLLLPSLALAQSVGRETGFPTPRFVSLKSEKANMRKGPGRRYPIEWVYMRKHLPLEIMEEFGHWRRVRDAEGQTGWLHKNMLSGSRYVLITADKAVTLYDDPQHSASAVVMLESGVIARLRECQADWCELTMDDYKGWLQKSKFFGAYDKELYNP